MPLQEKRNKFNVNIVVAGDRNKANRRHTSCALQTATDGQTDRPTDRQTNEAAYRVACTRLIKDIQYCHLLLLLLHRKGLKVKGDIVHEEENNFEFVLV